MSWVEQTDESALKAIFEDKVGCVSWGVACKGRAVFTQEEEKSDFSLSSAEQIIFNPVDWLTTSNQYLQSYKVWDTQENDRKTKQHIYKF